MKKSTVFILGLCSITAHAHGIANHIAIIAGDAKVNQQIDDTISKE